MFENKIICVLGGTGTIGSLIVEYFRKKKQGVKTIRILSNDENSLWEKQQEWGDHKLRYLLGDIRDYERMKRALKGVNYAFNCAAIKHITFAEYNPMEAVLTNIMGLENIIEACINQKVEKLLHISTDKAVEPTSIMGCTKKVSERLLQIRWAQNPNIQMVCVRLGNIYGSRGSIIPLIKKQKQEEKSITITNLDMERFFMYSHDAINFIIKAFEEGKNGEIWIPKLKEQKIMDVITKEIGNECSIEIIGNRRCEKLHERLYSDCEIPYMDESHETYWIIRNDNIN